MGYDTSSEILFYPETGINEFFTKLEIMVYDG